MSSPIASRRLATALALLGAILATVPLAAATDLPRKLTTAAEVYRELLSAPDRGVPEELVDRARCVAIVPNVIKGAFGWGGRHGRGVLTCRNDEGAWSPPAFISVSGGSFGLQIGANSTDFVIFFMNERSVRSLLSSRFTLGADASVAAGPVGRTAEASTDLKLNAEIYSYSRSRGLFAGISLEGAHMAPHQKSIQRFYGERVWPDEILFDHQVPRLPSEAKAFMEVLP